MAGGWWGGSGEGAVGGAAGVSGVAGDALGLLDFFEVAASGGAVGPQVVGGDAGEEGGVFGVVVEDLGLEVDAEAVGGAGDGDG